MKKRILCLLLALALLLPAEALAAARVSIQLPYKVGMLYIGESYRLNARVRNVSRASLVWASSNERVLTANGSLLTGASEGLCWVRASCGRTRALCGAVVVPASITLEAGGTHQLPYNKVLKYAASNASVASISDTGLVTAVRAGEAMVRISYGKVHKVIKVTVNEATPEFGDPTPSPVPTATATAQAEQSRAALLDCADTASQIVLVEYSGGSSATVSFHQKTNGVWTEIASTRGYVGKNGIGKTKEGDRKTPTGTFNLTTPFGIKSDPGSKMPYTKVTKYHYWCGTSSSVYYNRFCDSRVNGRAATSSDEVLYRYAGNYNYCLFIDYNAAGEPGLGSCIFLHCTGSNRYTAGCVAIPEKYMKQCICWAEEGCRIVIR